MIGLVLAKWCLVIKDGVKSAPLENDNKQSKDEANPNQANS